MVVKQVNVQAFCELAVLMERMQPIPRDLNENGVVAMSRAYTLEFVKKGDNFLKFN